MPATLNMSVGAVRIGDSAARSGQKSAERELGAGIIAISSLALRAPESSNFSGGDTADAFRVFLAGNSTTTASTSFVESVNTGSEAGVYWAVREGTATFGSGSSAHTEPRRGLPMQATSLTLAHTGSFGTARSGILDTSDGVSLSRDGAVNGGIKGGVTSSQTLSPVPEPATLLLFASGFAGLLVGKAATRRTKALRAEQSI